LATRSPHETLPPGRSPTSSPSTRREIPRRGPSPLGKTLFQGIREYAKQNNIEVEGLPNDPTADVPPEQLLPVLRNLLATIFPLLAPAAPSPGDSGTPIPADNAR
jgi:hypothetical protein